VTNLGIGVWRVLYYYKLMAHRAKGKRGQSNLASVKLIHVVSLHTAPPTSPVYGVQGAELLLVGRGSFLLAFSHVFPFLGPMMALSNQHWAPRIRLSNS
jgi:hypothetical protein